MSSTDAPVDSDPMRDPAESSGSAFEPTDEASGSGGPPQLSRAYLERVRLLEAHPENQDGADKSWIHRFTAWADAHHARAVRA